MLTTTPFVFALPDTDDAAALARGHGFEYARCLMHPSGRPWLLLNLPRHLPVLVSSDQTTVVVGYADLDVSALDGYCRRARSVDDLTQIQSECAGSFSVYASVGHTLFASGPALETRRTFVAEVDGVQVLSDRADALAALGGLDLDDVAVITSVCRGVPHPSDAAPMWRGITVVRGDQFVVVENGQSVRTGTWWTRPEPVLDRQEGAARVRDALAAAVAVRTRGGGTVACDLSGGLDSTPLCYFAAQSSEALVARTFFTEDPGGREDLEWARRALPSMPGVTEHVVFSTEGIPGFYQDLYGLGVPLDEPTQAGGSIPRVRHMLHDDLERGVRLHLNGLGGDHLFRGVRSWNHTLARTRPRLAWSRARAEDIPSRVPAWTTAHQLADRRPYQRWLLDTLNLAARGIEPPTLPRSDDWSVPLSMPSWLSTMGRDQVLKRLRDAAHTPGLATDLAGHFDLFTVRQAGRLARSMGQIGDTVGVSYEAPMLDDRVVEAVLAVRYEERDTPVEWKPLIKEAMRGLLPEDYLRRTNKIGGSPQAVRGYAANYPTLRRLWADSGLLDTDLIDCDALSAQSSPSVTQTPSTHVHALTDTAIFLQSQQRPSAQSQDADLEVVS